MENTNTKAPSALAGFVDFIRTQGVVGLAVGFILGGAVSKLVSALVENIINPLVGLALGKVDLADKAITLGTASLKYGAFISTMIDFIIIAAVVYFGVKSLGLDKLDKPKAYRVRRTSITRYLFAHPTRNRVYSRTPTTYVSRCE